MLTEIINTNHENVKYLPGFSLPENVVAVKTPLASAKTLYHRYWLFVNAHHHLYCSTFFSCLSQIPDIEEAARGTITHSLHSLILMLSSRDSAAAASLSHTGSSPPP